MEQEKKCDNCKYFIAHYAKKETSFQKLLDGHCINNELNASRKRNKYRLYENCDKWESNSELKKQRKESVKKVLEDMRDSLNQIAQILSDDL
ncbi:MAG: hypothetical protein K2I29_05230 [Clostridia bacterium]|nr:hypothetical protein [Clostridia bacterium]